MENKDPKKVIITDTKGNEREINFLEYIATCINKFCENKNFFIGQHLNTGIIFWVNSYKDYGFFINNKEYDFHIYYCIESHEDNYLDKLQNHIFIQNKVKDIPIEFSDAIRLESMITKSSWKYMNKLFSARKSFYDTVNIMTPQDKFNQYPTPIKIKNKSIPLFRSFLNDVNMDNHKILLKIDEIDNNFDVNFFYKIKDLKIKDVLNITLEEKEIIELSTDISVPNSLLNSYKTNFISHLKHTLKKI